MADVATTEAVVWGRRDCCSVAELLSPTCNAARKSNTPESACEDWFACAVRVAFALDTCDREVIAWCARLSSE
jgi:hypothetical protein